MADAHEDLYWSRTHQSNCKWVPGWWDPICRVCQELKNIETRKRAEEKAMSEATEPLPAPPSSLMDWRGIQYRPGTRIFYPIARNSSSYMVEAIVETIDWDPYGAKRYERYGGRLPNVRVKVKVLGDSTRNKRSRDWAYPTTGSITVAG